MTMLEEKNGLLDGCGQIEDDNIRATGNFKIMTSSGYPITSRQGTSHAVDRNSASFIYSYLFSQQVWAVESDVEIDFSNIANVGFYHDSIISTNPTTIKFIGKAGSITLIGCLLKNVTLDFSGLECEGITANGLVLDNGKIVFGDNKFEHDLITSLAPQYSPVSTSNGNDGVAGGIAPESTSKAEEMVGSEIEGPSWTATIDEKESEMAPVISNGAKTWYKDNKRHRDNDKPAAVYANGDMSWYQHGQLHRDNDQPAVVYGSGEQKWYLNGKLHRSSGKPAIITNDRREYWENGVRSRIEYINEEGRIHRVKAPAIVYDDGRKFWYQNGRIHRDGGPALEYPDGAKFWHQNGLCHRDDGPAIEYPDGTKFWYQKGFRVEPFEKTPVDNQIAIWDGAEIQYHSKVATPLDHLKSTKAVVANMPDTTITEFYLSFDANSTNPIASFPTPLVVNVEKEDDTPLSAILGVLAFSAGLAVLKNRSVKNESRKAISRHYEADQRCRG